MLGENKSGGMAVDVETVPGITIERAAVAAGPAQGPVLLCVCHHAHFGCQKTRRASTGRRA